jgi:DNA-binding NarL/FixJ family response regulator
VAVCPDFISVFIAEDHSLFREVIRDLLLRQAEMRIVGEAADGAQAFDGIQSLHPRVAVLDLEMPLWTGLEVAEAVREKGLETAIVLLTMHKEAHLVRSALEFGIAGYVLKDDLDTDLVPAIEAAANNRRHFSGRLAEIVGAAFKDQFPPNRL